MEHYRALKVWQRAMEMVCAAYSVSSLLPAQERYESDQTVNMVGRSYCLTNHANSLIHFYMENTINNRTLLAEARLTTGARGRL